MLVGSRITIAQQVYTEIEITSTLNDALKQTTAENIEATLLAFQNAYGAGELPELQAERYTNNGLNEINQLWSEKPFRCLYSRIKSSIVQRSIDGRFEFRGVTFHLEDDSGDALTQEGVFIIDEAGRIDGFSLAWNFTGQKKSLRMGSSSQRTITDFLSWTLWRTFGRRTTVKISTIWRVYSAMMP